LLKADSFFDTDSELFRELFAETLYVWDGLANIGQFLENNLQPNSAAVRKGSAQISRDTILYRGEILVDDFRIDSSGKKIKVYMNDEILEGATVIYAGSYLMDDHIFLGSGVVVEPSALIRGPSFIGDNTEVRHGAYIRGQVITGEDCVVGHATEIKSSVMLGGSKAGHFAYIGDSILGRVNLGAGTKLANLKMSGTPVNLHVDGRLYQTGLRKFGAILADGVETGCNSVTSPGTLLGKNVMLYPNGAARGFYPADTIIRVRQKHDMGRVEMDK